jgi:hypothetical protein
MDASSIPIDASGTTPSPDTLRGLVSSTHTFAPALATCSGVVPRIGVHSPRRWQHAQGLRLALVFIRPVLATRSGDAPALVFIRPALVTRSGAAPRISVHSPGVGKHARGLRLALVFSYIHSTLATRSGATPYCPMLATRSGTAPSNPMLATRSGATLTC